MTLREAYDQLKDSEDPAVQIMLKAAIVQLQALDSLTGTVEWAKESLDLLEGA